MLRPQHEIRPGCRASVLSRLVLAAGAGLFVGMAAARPALADANGEPARSPVRAGSGSGAPDANARQPARSRPPRLGGLTWLRSETGSDNWGVGKFCLALVLAICGGIALAARRLAPRAAAGAVQVVGRVSLSPKHSVYLLRVGRRVLVLGAGPQGPPALITELDDVPQEPPAPRQEAES